MNNNLLKDFLREESIRINKAINKLTSQEGSLARADYLAELSDLLEEKRAIKLQLMQLV